MTYIGQWWKDDLLRDLLEIKDQERKFLLFPTLQMTASRKCLGNLVVRLDPFLALVFRGIKESEGSKLKTHLWHGSELIKYLLNQLVSYDISRVTLLNVYRLGSQMNLKHDQTGLLKAIFESPNEKDLLLQNGHTTRW